MFNYKSIKVITYAKCYTNYNFGSDLRALALKWPQGCENGPHHWLGHYAYNQWGTIRMLYAAHILYTGLIPYQKRNECGQYCRSYSGHESIYRQTDGRTDKPTDRQSKINILRCTTEGGYNHDRNMIRRCTLLYMTFVMATETCSSNGKYSKMHLRWYMPDCLLNNVTKCILLKVIVSIVMKNTILLLPNMLNWEPSHLLGLCDLVSSKLGNSFCVWVQVPFCPSYVSARASSISCIFEQRQWRGWPCG